MYKRVTVLSENIFEVKTYDRLNIKGGGDKSDVEKGQGICNETNYETRQKMRRTKVRQLITCNFDEHSKFITLTFANGKIDDVTDVKIANKSFRLFIERLTRHEGHKIDYVAVIEFQDSNGRGAVHYHMIADLPYIPNKILREIWGNGYVTINDITKVDNVGAYVIKYMTKDIDDNRLQGLKAYNCSLGLKRPETLDSWVSIDSVACNQLIETLQSKTPVYSAKYTSEECGNITFNQYNFNRKKTQE